MAGEVENEAMAMGTEGRHRWPQEMVLYGNSSSRAQARPKKRWTDDVQSYLSDLQITQPWQELAQMQDIWADLEPGFLTWAITPSRQTA